MSSCIKLNHSVPFSRCLALLEGEQMPTYRAERWLIETVVAVIIFLVFSGAAMARDYTPTECPVVANTDSGIYHTRSSLNYRMMLQENKNKKKDNRKCFKTELEAKMAGYRKAK
jgi:hypothetical protein